MANWRFPFVVKFLTCPMNNGLKQGRLDSRPLEDIIQLQISVFLYQIARKPNFFKQSVRTNVLRTLDHECCSVWNSFFRWMLANQKPRKQPLLRAEYILPASRGVRAVEWKQNVGSEVLTAICSPRYLCTAYFAKISLIYLDVTRKKSFCSIHLLRSMCSSAEFCR